MNRHLGLMIGAALLATPPVCAQTTAITGGTVFTGAGQRIPSGTILIRNGLIVEIGANVAVPAGATRVDASGKWVTPGLIHMSANAGLGVRSLNGFGESNQTGDITAAFNVSEGIDPDALDIAVARTGGVTTALLSPGGNFIAGQAVVVDYVGARIEDLVVRSPAAMVINLSSGSRSAGGNTRAGALSRLRQVLRDAQEYAARRDAFRVGQIQDLAAPAADLEALQPFLRGALPVLLIANRKSDIESALRIAAEFRLRAIIGGGAEAWKVAAALAQAGVPVALNPTQDIPSFDALGARLDNGALLREAGVTVLLAHRDSGGERNLRFGAGNAVRNGMTWDDALRSITLAPAEALGLGDQYGSLAQGKVANVVVWSGDPFELATVAERVFIRGAETSLRTRETELLERYRTLPPKY